jgi:hypothetical protein
MLEHGMPTIAPIYHAGHTPASPIVIEKTKWPVDASTRYPEIASKTSQIMNFGEQHYFVSNALHQLRLFTVLVCLTRSSDGRP